jgi:hypothetical protein
MPLAAAALAAALSVTSAWAGPPTGTEDNALAQWFPLVERVALVCLANGRACNPDLAALASPADLLLSGERVVWPGCSDDPNADPETLVCAPRYVGGAVLRGLLTVAVEQAESGSERSLSVTASYEVRAQVAGQTREYVLTPQRFAAAGFEPGDCTGDFDAPGARIGDWFPVGGQDCIFDQPDVVFVGMLIPEPASVESDLVAIGRDAFPALLAGRSVVPVLMEPDGRPARAPRKTETELEPSIVADPNGRTTVVGRFPVTVRFAEAR